MNDYKKLLEILQEPIEYRKVVKFSYILFWQFQLDIFSGVNNQNIMFRLVLVLTPINI